MLRYPASRGDLRHELKGVLTWCLEKVNVIKSGLNCNTEKHIFVFASTFEKQTAGVIDSTQ